jgi:hypothetical protein
MIVGVLLAACSGAEPPRASEPRPSPPPVEFVNGGPCPTALDLPQLGDRAGCVTTTHSDDATLFVYAIVDEESLPVKWRIRYESEDVEFDRSLDAGNPFSYPRAIGAIDIDGDGSHEWVIKAVDLAGHGTNWQRLQIFVVGESELRVVTYEGQPLFMNVAGISRMGEGARCEDGRLVLLRTEARDRQNTVWDYSERVMELDGNRVELLRRRQGVLRLTDYNDPKLDPYYRLECGDLVYP